MYKINGCLRRDVAFVIALFSILCAVLLSVSVMAATSLKNRDIKKGRRAYMRHCSQCHGKTGEGDGEGSMIQGVSTVDLTNRAYMSLLSDQEIYERIYYGDERYPYLQMVGWQNILSSGTIWDIVAYIRTLEVDKGPLKGPTPQERAQRFLEDPMERGRVYYMRYCSQCHGRYGDGKGWARRSLVKEPVSLISSRFTAEQIVDYVRGKTILPADSREMPVFGKAIGDDVVRYIALYITTRLSESTGSAGLDMSSKR